MPKRTVLIFVLGLLLGSLAGGMAVAWMLEARYEEDAVARNYAIVRTGPETSVSFTAQPIVRSETGVDLPPEDFETESEASTIEDEPEFVADSLSIVPSDSITHQVPLDSLPDLSPPVDTLLASSEPIVRQDERFDVRALLIQDFSDSIPQVTRIDSLLAEAADIHADPVVTALNTEFWRSPLNYRGYRMGKNQLLLYGVYQPDSVQLWRFEERLLLVTPGAVYRLDPTDDFQPFRTEADPRALSAVER